MSNSVDQGLLTGLAEACGQEASFLESLLSDFTGGERELLEFLIQKGLVGEEECYRCWAEWLGLPFHALDERDLDRDILQRLPMDLSRRHGVVPVGEDPEIGMIDVVLRDPFDLMAVDAIQEYTRASVQVMVSSPSAIDRMLQRLDRQHTGIEGLIARIQKAEGDLDTLESTEKLKEAVGDNAVVQLVDYLIEEGLRTGSSDVHVEPQRHALRVRVRIDGKLETLHRFPGGLQRAVTSRIKVMAGMDIGESRRPQDGRFLVGEGIEVRASCLPCSFGEKIVLRILDRRGLSLDPKQLGMSERNLALFRRGYQSANGMVLLTGPTGSGKTTTLYTALGELNVEDRNVITVEDPVEYELNGATQVQVDIKADRTFAKTLRSMLRQDPDVIMVGEIRDPETASIAIQAALTGHMVLSTLHTNDALATIHRLIDMGLPRYLVGPALRAIVGQRLIPRLCGECAIEDDPAPELLAEFGAEGAEFTSGFRKSLGCPACRDRGYRGRIAVHEVLLVSSEMGRMISRGAPETEIREAAIAAGYRPMSIDGLEKASQGLVAVEEVLAAAREA